VVFSYDAAAARDAAPCRGVARAASEAAAAPAPQRRRGPRVGDHGPALLALEDGRVFPGVAFGARCSGQGDLVVNTSQTGYQEIATDPSYAGQLVVMTYR